MKKERIITAIIVALLTGVVVYYASSPENGILNNSDVSSNEHIATKSDKPEIDSTNLSDYEVLSSYSSSSAGGHRETEIDVAVYSKQHSEELYKRIEDEHNRLNGEPDTLKINLYHSDTEFTNGTKPYAVIYIDYINDIREIAVAFF
ncbi:hypothetical protein [Sporofaciens musculi]|uniref:hypothetical protein n=1 Tax=Sporofaciens musculi TaxID=2681861 RepID=UPI0025A02898|nr:hypothetical protein [Sporofaciens musculi]